MSNKTQADALQVRGQNPQNLVEAMVRQKIYQNRYWKEKLPGLTAASIIDEALELEYVGGTYSGSRKPSKFLMLTLKLLQISPEKAEVMEYILQEDYKYLTALGCFYIRLTASHDDVYKNLEPLYEDFRKLRFRNLDGSFSIIHMDEFVNSLLTEEAYLDTLLPHITKRHILEENRQIKPRVSPLEEMLEEELKKEEEEREIARKAKELANASENATKAEQGVHSDRWIKKSSQEREVKPKNKRDRSVSSSSENRHGSGRRKQSRREEKSKHKDWRKVIKGKYSSTSRRDKSKSVSPSPQKKQQKEPEKDSVEYWNKIRAEMGIQLM